MTMKYLLFKNNIAKKYFYQPKNAILKLGSAQNLDEIPSS
jgi:hypothetical protein